MYPRMMAIAHHCDLFLLRFLLVIKMGLLFYITVGFTGLSDGDLIYEARIVLTETISYSTSIRDII